MYYQCNTVMSLYNRVVTTGCLIYSTSIISENVQVFFLQSRINACILFFCTKDFFHCE